MDLQHCRVQGHRDGYGFAIPLSGDGSDDIYLSARQMALCLRRRRGAGPRVTGQDQRGRLEGKIVEVLKQRQLAARSWGATTRRAASVSSVIPDNAAHTAR